MLPPGAHAGRHGAELLNAALSVPGFCGTEHFGINEVLRLTGYGCVLKNRKNNYPFAEEEMYGYKKDKVLEIYHDSKPSILQKVGIK